MYFFNVPNGKPDPCLIYLHRCAVELILWRGGRRLERVIWGENVGPQRLSPELAVMVHNFGGERDIVDMVSHAPCSARRTAPAKLSFLLHEEQ
jgi:hypothetical protein